MNFIISPAKKMQADPDSIEPAGLPVYLTNAQQLWDYLRGLSQERLKRLLACNDAIAELNYQRYQTLSLRRAQTPALLAYQGIQYQYMAPGVFERRQFDYLQKHLFILSGLYGALRPLDAVVPYRLEMQAKLKTPFCQSLYDYWGGLPAQLVTEGDGVLIDLASAEYSRAVRPHLPPSVRLVRCVFAERQGEKLVEKGVHVKMARGEMVRWLARQELDRPEGLPAFNELGFCYAPEQSGPDCFVFIKRRKETC